MIGTTVTRIGATSNTTCGTITAALTGDTVTDHTYTVTCDSTEATLAVLLYDDVVEETHDVGNYDSAVVMNIVEVQAYGEYIFGENAQ